MHWVNFCKHVDCLLIDQLLENDLCVPERPPEFTMGTDAGAGAAGERAEG